MPQEFLHDFEFRTHTSQKRRIRVTKRVPADALLDTTMTVGYVGNHGVHMLDREDDVNSVLPTATPQGLLWPSPRGSGTKLNPNIGDIRGLYWTGDAEYDALEVGVLKRMSHGFQHVYRNISTRNSGQSSSIS
jgi:hypothetical protein